jgi:hypothetical protein
MNDLRETVAAFQSTQRRILDEIEGVKQKIAAEQGKESYLLLSLDHFRSV